MLWQYTANSNFGVEKNRALFGYFNDYQKCAFATQCTPNLIIKLSKRMKFFDIL